MASWAGGGQNLSTWHVARTRHPSDPPVLFAPGHEGACLTALANTAAHAGLRGAIPRAAPLSPRTPLRDCLPSKALSRAVPLKVFQAQRTEVTRRACRGRLCREQLPALCCPCQCDCGRSFPEATGITRRCRNTTLSQQDQPGGTCAQSGDKLLDTPSSQRSQAVMQPLPVAPSLPWTS